MAITIDFNNSTYRVKNYYDRRYVVQYYQKSRGHWYTVKICHNDAEWKAYLHEQNQI